jgi:hypothetical protein
MAHVVTTAREADRFAERNRVAWNLPRGRLAAPAQETLDWYAFLARYFPARGRHDFEALTAYAAYRSSGGTARPEAEAFEQPQPASSAATPEDAREYDGGATLANGWVPAATS